MNPVRLIAGDAHPALARRVAELARAELVACMATPFADGELGVRIEADVQASDLYVVQPTSPPVNERLTALALIGDAARAAGAARLTAVIPYFGYARQDVRKRPGEARSAQIAARVLECAGFDRLVALELHSPALESAFRIPLMHLEADDAALPLIRDWRLNNLTVVSPDAGGVKRAQRYASALHAPLALVTKMRPQADEAAALSVLGEVLGRRCLIVDDMASTGATIAGAAQLLHEAGAAAVHAFFVHAVMALGALERIKAAGVRLIASTDTIAPPSRAPCRASRASMADYPRELEQRHTLADAREVLIRPVRAEDGARYAAIAASRSCDFGIVIADDWHKTGIAGLLMAALIDHVRERGFETMESLVLRDNAEMLRFVRALGFEVHPLPADATIVQVAKRLRAPRSALPSEEVTCTSES